MSNTTKTNISNDSTVCSENTYHLQEARKMLTPLFAALAQRIASDHSATNDVNATAPWMGVLIAGGALLVAASALISG